MNSRVRALGLTVLCLLLAALATRKGGLAWLALPVLSYLGAGLLLAPVRGEARMRAARRCEEVAREGQRAVEVVVSLRNEGSRRLRARISEPILRGMKVVEGGLELRASLLPGEEAELRYVFEARRGGYRWETLRAILGDPFGLVEIEEELPAQARILVQPSYRKMPSFPLRLRRTLSSPGSIPIRLGGGGTDFWGIREYRPGDPLKRLYWRLNARNPLRRYTKEFIQERTAEVILVLDGRQRMELSVQGSSLFEREVSVIASLADMLIRQGQRVGLSVIGTSARGVLPDYGRIQLRRILNCLAEVECEGEYSSRGVLRYLPALRYSRSAFMIVVSPFAKRDESFFQLLRALGYQAVLVSPDTLDFAAPALARDALSELALRVCRIERALGLGLVSRLSFPVVDWRLDGDLPRLLEKAFMRCGAGR